jgi:hypothetical protein
MSSNMFLNNLHLRLHLRVHHLLSLFMQIYHHLFHKFIDVNCFIKKTAILGEFKNR